MSEGKQKIVIVDVDGTISKVGDRLKYLQQKPKNWDSFYSSCFEDEPIKDMCHLVDRMEYMGYFVYFCTGRRECVRAQTAKWISKNVFNEKISSIDVSGMLLMRKDGDKRHDTEAKPELLKEAGIDIKDIAFVLEDRNSMVKKWRDMGLICLQVAEGDF